MWEKKSIQEATPHLLLHHHHLTKTTQPSEQKKNSKSNSFSNIRTEKEKKNHCFSRRSLIWVPFDFCLLCKIWSGFLILCLLGGFSSRCVLSKDYLWQITGGSDFDLFWVGFVEVFFLWYFEMWRDPGIPTDSFYQVRPECSDVPKTKFKIKVCLFCKNAHSLFWHTHLVNLMKSIWWCDIADFWSIHSQWAHVIAKFTQNWHFCVYGTVQVWV